MTRFGCFLFIFATMELKLSNSKTMDRYKAAVVEYRPLWDSEESSSANILANARMYSEIIETDIIVFPSHGLTGYIEDTPKINAEDKTQEQVLQIISDAAKKNFMYVIINFVENLNMSIFTTNFIFDRNGTVISKYRKFNTRDKTAEADIITFDTDFGVKFGTFVGVDILLESPAMELVRQGIRDFVYPTAWINEFPFLSAIQAQWSWSYGNDVNLLAANINHIDRGITGSGLHRGRQDKSISKQTVFKGSFMIIGNIHKKGYPYAANLTYDDVVIQLEKPSNGSLFVYKDDINEYKTQLLNISASKEDIYENGRKIGYRSRTHHKSKLCEKGFCCLFETNFTSTYLLESTAMDKFRYRFMVFNRKRKFQNIEFGLQLCAIGPLINESKSSCFDFPHENYQIDDKIYILNSTEFDSINITAKFKEAEILPNIFEFPHSVPDPNKIIFTSNEDGTTIIFKSNNLISIGLWGRVYTGDKIPNITYYLLGAAFLTFCILLSMVGSCRRHKRPKRALRSRENPTFRLQVTFGKNKNIPNCSHE